MHIHSRSYIEEYYLQEVSTAVGTADDLASAVQRDGSKCCTVKNEKVSFGISACQNSIRYARHWS